MKKTIGYLILAAALGAILAGVTNAQGRAPYWPFPEHGHQPDFIAETRIVAKMEPRGAGHGDANVTRFVAGTVLRNKAGSACWIGNDTEPHNWAVAPLEACR